MIFLILESLGSTEFVFILLMALVFFGPRKLPQLSRTIGKNLASFRRASEDFKSTWEREVNLEEFKLSQFDQPSSPQASDNSILRGEPMQPTLPTIEPVETDRVVARQVPTADSMTQASELVAPAEPLQKRDWL